MPKRRLAAALAGAGQLRALLRPGAVAERVNTHAAPSAVVVVGAADQRGVPVADSATLAPKLVFAACRSSFGPCCVQVVPERVNTHAAPRVAAVVAGAADQRRVPVRRQRHAGAEPAGPLSPLAVSFGPCCVQVLPERVNTHAAPTPSLSSGPPISAVFPSADSATLTPKPAPAALVAARSASVPAG